MLVGLVVVADEIGMALCISFSTESPKINKAFLKLSGIVPGSFLNYLKHNFSNEEITEYTIKKALILPFNHLEFAALAKQKNPN